MKWALIIILYLYLLSPIANAQSDYVLPYPSFMPGSPFYKINLFKEEILKFWYFGNFGQFKYNLKFSDKYLVEAKTLFEYQQYLLAVRALQKSSSYFESTQKSLINAQKEKKDTKDQLLILKGAAKKHTEVLQKLAIGLPETFIWQPERTKPTTLYLKKSIENAILIRERNLWEK